MYCKFCGKKLEEDSKFCNNCGRSQQLEKESIEYNKNQEEIHCPNCKNKELAFLTYPDKYKPYGPVFYTLYGLFAIPMLIMMILVLTLEPTVKEFFEAPTGIASIALLIGLMFTIGLRVKQPYQEITRIQFICKKCGHHGIIDSDKETHYTIKSLKK